MPRSTTDWLKIGNVSKIKQDDIGIQFKYKRKVKEAYMPEAEIEKNVWVLKATPAVLEKVYQGKDMEFRDAAGKSVWTNKKDDPLCRIFRQVPASRMRVQVAAAQSAGPGLFLSVPS